MADYNQQLADAHLGVDRRTPTEVNLRKVAMLYEIFQRVGAIDVYFGLHKERRANTCNPSSRPSSYRSSDPRMLRQLSGESHETATTISEPKGVQKIFTVDELYRSRLMDRYDGNSFTPQPTNTVTISEEVADGGAPNAPNAEASGEVSHTTDIENRIDLADSVSARAAENEAQAQDSARNSDSYSIYTNRSATQAQANNLAKSLSNHGTTQGTGLSLERSAAERSRSSNGRQGEAKGSEPAAWKDENGTLLFAESLDISRIYKSKNSMPPKTPADNATCNLSLPYCSEATIEPPSCGYSPDRLRIFSWVKDWFVPNLLSAMSCMGSAAVFCGDRLRQYFTPLEISKTSRKFDEVYLSSLEFAILKDEMTRCYFNITDERKEHLMMREVDDFRRLYMRKRISFEEFCQHFSPYLSRRPEDYTRNKNTDDTDELMQRRALKRVLEKSLYGLSVERPNEFVNRQCMLKPYQMIEPIPPKT
ncbi:entry exclusion 2, putative [Babesia ovata]|uniref:Entry exclusion 2, putative n=1 Tax=Babesia ovata TaxID=189622 RepID=A0A2H6KBI1_9APIC|nr:entry exclusion 2, putative [Babesia ovata]GBE60344.1 entry exclusion 2, putative [Babesia ovata]